MPFTASFCFPTWRNGWENGEIQLLELVLIHVLMQLLVPLR